MRARTTGTSTINPWISSNPSSAAQARQSQSRAVPPQWLPVLLASGVVPPSPQSCTVSTYWDSPTLPDGYGPGSFNFMVTGHTEDTNVDCVISSSVGSTCCAGGGGWTFRAGRTEAKGGTPTSEPAAGDTVTCTAQGGGCTGQSDTCTYKGGAECMSWAKLSLIPRYCLTYEVWSEDKVKWCCDNYQRGCESGSG